MLETKPLIWIIYAQMAVIVFLVGQAIYGERQSKADLTAKDAIITAQARELINAYKETKDTYKELNTIFQPSKYYEKGHSNNDDHAADSDRR